MWAGFAIALGLTLDEFAIRGRPRRSGLDTSRRGEALKDNRNDDEG